MIFFTCFWKSYVPQFLASLIRKLRFKPIGNRGIQVSKKASKHKSIKGNIYWKSQILHDFTSQKKEDICCKNWLGANLGDAHNHTSSQHHRTWFLQDSNMIPSLALPQITWETARSICTSIILLLFKHTACPCDAESQRWQAFWR